MQNVYTKRGIKLKFIAQPYGDENPKVDVYYDNPTFGTRQMLAEDVEITSTDPANPQEVSVFPITKGGEQNITIVFKNDLYDEDGDRNIQLVAVDLDQNNDVTPDSYSSWVWTSYNFDGVEVTNENTVFDYITITHTAPFNLKFDFEEITQWGQDDAFLKEIVTVSDALWYGDNELSTNPEDTRIVSNGLPYTGFTIPGANQIQLDGNGTIDRSETWEIVYLRNHNFQP